MKDLATQLRTQLLPADPTEENSESEASLAEVAEVVRSFTPAEQAVLTELGDRLVTNVVSKTVQRLGPLLPAGVAINTALPPTPTRSDAGVDASPSPATAVEAAAASVTTPTAEVARLAMDAEGASDDAVKFSWDEQTWDEGFVMPEVTAVKEDEAAAVNTL